MFRKGFMNTINLAVIAHVDAGKSTLIDAMLNQSGVFEEHSERIDLVMDSNELERERGITIYSKNCSIRYKDYTFNIVDTPGHADFSSEVERIMKTVDTVVLLVDAAEGPMPQTRYVLKKSLEHGLRPILLINKFDKRDQRAETVVDLSFDLFDDLGASDDQLDFPILYGVAKEGIVRYDMDDDNEDLVPLFETIIQHVPPFEAQEGELLMQISSLAYDDYIGRLGIGRLLRGSLKPKQEVMIANERHEPYKAKINQVFRYIGLTRTSVDLVEAGDIVLISGIDQISIGDTIGPASGVEALPSIPIEPPTLAMDFYVNNSPFAGQAGKYLTTRHIRERLIRELETNVGLTVEPIPGSDAYEVSGRGELHLSILIEQMRREGYELSVSKPRVLYKEVDGKLLEPYSKVRIEAPDEYIGSLIRKLNQRKGMMEGMTTDAGYTTIEYLAPSRALLGFRGEVINDTRGEGIFMRQFDHYGPYAGEIKSERNGPIVSKETGTVMAYSLFQLIDRGEFFVKPGQEVYEGMIIGLNNRQDDLVVNPTHNKKMTNTRSSGADDALRVPHAREFSLEEALAFIEDDEWVEVTPDAIRLRKKALTHADRVRLARTKKSDQTI